jgi:hypothetical protein
MRQEAHPEGLRALGDLLADGAESHHS